MKRPSKPKFENSKITAIKHVFGTSILAFLKACYPILVFFAIRLLVILILSLFPVMLFEEVKEAIGSMVGLFYLIPVFRKDILMHSVVTFYRPREKEEKRRMWGRWIYAIITITMFSIAVNNILGYTALRDLSSAYDEIKASFLAGPVVTQVICLGIVIPYAEELLFRGIIYGRAKEAFGPQKAILISALLFGIVHWNLLQFIYATIMGLMLAYFVEKYRSLVPAYFGHAAANTIVVAHAAVTAYYGHQPLLHLVITIIAIVAAGLMFLIQFRNKRLQ